MLKVILPLLYIGLVIYALADIIQSDEEDLRGLPKMVWVLLVIFLPLIGAVTWVILSMASRRARHIQQSHPGPSVTFDGRNPRKPPTPAGPEDDPEYMWLLEQSKRKREREKRQHNNGQNSEPPSQGDPTKDQNDDDAT